MEKTELGNTGILVTPVGMGVLTMGASQLNLSLEEGAGLIRYAYDRGIRFFDTAQYYDCYHYLREAFRGIDTSRNNPERPVICSKSLTATYEGMEEAVLEALRDLGLESIDLFLLHEVRHDPDFEIRGGAWKCLQDMKQEGLIGAIGVSTHHVDVTERMAEEPACDAVFALTNYAGLGIRKGSGAGSAPEMERAVRSCLEAGKGVFAMKAFGGGNLSADYRRALDYVRDLGVHSIMVGLGKREEADRLIQYAEGTLPDSYAPDVSGKRIRIDQSDCEGCGACLSRCPNHAISWNENGLADVDHQICLTCGYCAPVCPVRAIIMW